LRTRWRRQVNEGCEFVVHHQVPLPSEPAPEAGVAVPLSSPAGRWLVVAAVLGSGMALLDGTVVNVAVKPIGDELSANLGELQWIINAYMLTLASLILIGGSLGDRLGRKRVFIIGVAWFAVASLLCGLAQSPLQLIVARAVQGVGAALLTPGSLAMIQGAIAPADRSKAIGIWSAYAGIAAAIGPLLGGWLIDVGSWRLVFLMNPPIAVIVVGLCARHVPETRNVNAARSFDYKGAALGALGLAGITYGLIESAWVAGLAGVVLLGAFVFAEIREREPMLPPGLFASRTFTNANALTLVVYGAMSGLIFLLVLQLQVSVGFSPLQAGLSTLPVPLTMLLLSPRSGALAARIGPRPQLILGPALCAVGVLLLARVEPSSSYVSDILPGILVFSLGLTAMVAPLTATVLAAASDSNAGIASGVNNAIARAASLLTVAALPSLVGLSGDDYRDPATLTDGFRLAMLLCAGLLVVGSLVAIRIPRTYEQCRRGASASDGRK
jgi:EmrB/QacA subfamily drug resistance transporter